jgi:BirA family biotin operon repressor/biotin-[acetyl-CoA-carboxylase] ligase
MKKYAAESTQPQSAELELLNILKGGGFRSGEDLGFLLGISRSAVWKRVRKLNSTLGVIVHSVPGRGYKLAQEIIKLEPVARFTGDNFCWDIDLHETVDSTNAESLRQIEAGRIAPFAVVSEMQTAGRGRRGRVWVSPYCENLYFSLVLKLGDGLRQLEGLSLSVGLAVLQSLKEVGLSAVGLKWPNDILASGSKVAGVLIELVGDVADTCHVVIGVGINVNMHSAHQEIDQSWTSVNLETGKSLDRNLMLSALQANLDKYLAVHMCRGFAVLRDEWEAQNLWSDRWVTLTSGANAVTGVFKGVDTTGALRLLVDGDVRVFNGGEISLRLDDDFRG